MKPSLFIAAASLFCTPALAIDFEDIPGVGTPFEGMEISDQYLATDGVTFSLEDGTNPVIAEVGAPLTGFWVNGGDPDTPLPDQGIGQFFLTDDGSVAGAISSPLIVSYATPTAAASGVVLDMDGDEVFTIEARDAAGNVLQTIVINAGDENTGDAVATPWAFDRASDDVHSIRFSGVRTDGGGFGLGFDLFEARSAGAELTVSPPSGTYASTQCFDLTLISEASSAAVGLTATLNGRDVSRGLWRCLRGTSGTLDAPLVGETFRCQRLERSILNPGTHVLDLQLELANGTVLNESVEWEVLGNTE